MLAKFYNCIRDERYVFKLKASDQTNTEDVYIEVLTPSENVTHPKIKVATGRLGKATNYVWISELKRFYYIRNWEMNNGYITMDLEVDVLMSYRKELMNSHAMIKRNEFSYSSYLPDEKLKIYAPSRVKVDKFKSPFDAKKQIFYLALVSGQGANNS